MITTRAPDGANKTCKTKERYKTSKKLRNCRLGKIHTTTRTNIIAMTMITKKTTTRILASVAVLYGEEG